MIVEHATLEIEPGREADFEAAFAAAPAIFAAVPGCHEVELRRCIENPGRYLLFVEWDDVEAHTVGFRQSPLFADWRALVGDFFAAPPAVEHYSRVAP
ncbi:MAG TPA: antibiotic biosynthesis monooxygenase [Solirubrobacterales bacterium]|nr:antibiotic biosynthesis monooxygenase [Solirubrobacterales bacterium]